MIFSLIPMFAISFAAAADEKPSGAENSTPASREVKFVCTTQEPNLKDPIRVSTTKETTVISVSKRVLSEPVKLPEDGQLRLLATAEKAENPGAQNDHVLVQTVVPPNAKKPLILLSPTGHKAGEAPENEVIATVLDLSTLESGDWFFVNVSNKNVGVVLDDEKSMIKPGDSYTHKTHFGPAAVAKTAEYQIFSIDGEKWALLASSKVIINPGRMEMSIFSDDAHSARVSYYGITLFEEAGAPKNEPVPN